MKAFLFKVYQRIRHIPVVGTLAKIAVPYVKKLVFSTPNNHSATQLLDMQSAAISGLQQYTETLAQRLEQLEKKQLDNKSTAIKSELTAEKLKQQLVELGFEEIQITLPDKKEDRLLKMKVQATISDR